MKLVLLIMVWGLSAVSLPCLSAPPGLDLDEEGYVETGSDVQGPAEQKDATFQVSDGTRVMMEDKGFSIAPPVGWEVSDDYPQLSLLIQAPYEKGMKYQRTIQVASFAGPKYIDSTTAREFHELITQKFSRASASVEDYRIRTPLDVEMADGRPGILFYSDFVLEGVPLMQMHVLVSSDTRHYLLTYTDLAERIEGPTAEAFVNPVWDSLVSVEIEGESVGRFDTPIQVGAALLAVLILGIGFRIFQVQRAKRHYQQFTRRSRHDHSIQETQDLKFLVSAEEAEISASQEESFPDATLAEATPLGVSGPETEHAETDMDGVHSLDFDEKVG